jgi:hypothetical protein
VSDAESVHVWRYIYLCVRYLDEIRHWHTQLAVDCEGTVLIR